MRCKAFNRITCPLRKYRPSDATNNFKKNPIFCCTITNRVFLYVDARMLRCHFWKTKNNHAETRLVGCVILLCKNIFLAKMVQLFEENSKRMRMFGIQPCHLNVNDDFKFENLFENLKSYQIWFKFWLSFLCLRIKGAYNRTSRPAVRPAKTYLTWPLPAALLRLHRLPV